MNRFLSAILLSLLFTIAGTTLSQAQLVQNGIIRFSNKLVYYRYDETDKAMKVSLMSQDNQLLKEYSKKMTGEQKVKFFETYSANNSFWIRYYTERKGAGGIVILDTALNEKQSIAIDDAGAKEIYRLKGIDAETEYISFPDNLVREFPVKAGKVYVSGLKEELYNTANGKSAPNDVTVKLLTVDEKSPYKLLAKKWAVSLGKLTLGYVNVFYADDEQILLYTKDNFGKIYTIDYLYRISAKDGSIISKTLLQQSADRGIDVNTAIYNKAKKSVIIGGNTFDVNKRMRDLELEMINNIVAEVSQDGQVVKVENLELPELNTKSLPLGWSADDRSTWVSKILLMPDNSYRVFVGQYIRSTNAQNGYGIKGFSLIGFARYTLSENLKASPCIYKQLKKFGSMAMEQGYSCSSDGSTFVFTTLEKSGALSRDWSPAAYYLTYSDNDDKSSEKPLNVGVLIGSDNYALYSDLVSDCKRYSAITYFEQSKMFAVLREVNGVDVVSYIETK